MADQHRDRNRSWAQDEDESSPSLKTNPLISHSTLFYFRAELCQRLSEAICSEGVKVNQVQRFYFFDSGQCPKTAGSVAGHRLVCRSASLLLFHPRGTQKDSTGRDVRRAMKLVEAGKRWVGGGIQSELTICQIACNAKGVIPLCNISRPGECGTHGKPPTKSYLLYRDMHFLGFNVAQVPMLGFIIYSISLVL